MNEVKPSTPHYALMVVSGKYTGQHYSILEQGDMIIGRMKEAQIVLIEDMISRRHARIFMQNGHLVFEDFGSTNGSFVNAEKVAGARLLTLGDHISVGNSVLVVTLQSEIYRANSAAVIMQGRLEEFSLVELLQMFAHHKKNALIMIQSHQSEGRIAVSLGQFLTASLNDEKLSPIKAFMRILAWNNGYFEVCPLPIQMLESNAQGLYSIEHLLLNTLRLQDEVAQFKKERPLPLEAKVRLKKPLPVRLKDLDAHAIDWIQLLIDANHIASALDSYPGPDNEVILALQNLLHQGILEIYDVHESTKEKTL